MATTLLSKDKLDGLPLVSTGLAVTRSGIPVRCWCWPGNTNDARVILEVKKGLIGWELGRVVTVVDRGFTVAQNLHCTPCNRLAATTSLERRCVQIRRNRRGPGPSRPLPNGARQRRDQGDRDR